MLLGLVQYSRGSKHLGSREVKAEAKTPEARARHGLVIGVELIVGVALVLTAFEPIGVIQLTLVDSRAPRGAIVVSPVRFWAMSLFDASPAPSRSALE